MSFQQFKFLEIILNSALKFLNFERGCIMLESLETGELYLRKSNRVVLECDDPEKFLFSMSVTDYTFETEKSIMIPDAREFTEFKSSQSIIFANIKSVIAVPLKVTTGAASSSVIVNV